MLERFARGKQLTQENPLLAIVIIPRKNRKFSVNFRMSLVYYKTVLLVHIAMKDGLRGKGKIIPWLKVLISGHCTFIAYPCIHMKLRCDKVNSAHPIIKLPKSALNTDLRVEAKEIRLPCLLAGHGHHSFLNILGISTSWASQFPWPFPPCTFCWVLVVAAEWKYVQW